jgi:AcrR family transcriptional regulator
MNLGTRERLLLAATRLFADSGYRGASVRDICNQAGANPGAISYHFGGKRQLYRSVLRQAADALAEMGPASETEDPTEAPSAGETLGRILRRLQTDDTATRLLLRDLADGGAVAVESLTPPLRSAFEQLNATLGEDDNPRGSAESRLLFLGMAAPLFLMTAAWPVLARALDLQSDQREPLFTELLHRVSGSHGASIP